jgi:hypothetical protein
MIQTLDRMLNESGKKPPRRELRGYDGAAGKKIAKA